MGREIIDEEQKLLEEIGKKLKILRKKTKKTLKQVSDEIHITAADISKYERGKRGDIGVLTLNKFCKYYNYNLTSLLYTCNKATNSNSINELLKQLNNDTTSYSIKVKNILQKLDNLKLEEYEEK